MFMIETLFLCCRSSGLSSERPLKVDVSIPESFKKHFIHLDKVEDVTGLCRGSIDRNKGFGLLSEIFGWNSLVKPS